MRSRPDRGKIVFWSVLAAVFLLLCAFFPPFHVRAVKTGDAGTSDGTAFHARDVARRLWEERLPGVLTKALNARTLLAAAAADPDAARKQYARTAGIGGPGYYLLSGTGRVSEKGRGTLGLDLLSPEAPASLASHPDTTSDILLQTGNIFGNAVRDGTALIDAKDFPNSADFNDLSDALNGLVETRVLPRLRDGIAIGTPIRFVGVVEVPEDQTIRVPLHMVPIFVEVR